MTFPHSQPTRQPIPSYTGKAADFVQEGAALPATISVDFQPYGRVTLGNLRLSPNRNLLDVNDLTGEVIDGSETSYLCGHTSTRKIAPGTLRTIYGIRVRELEAGNVVRVAM
jgi:hypothetical protein